MELAVVYGKTQHAVHVDLSEAWLLSHQLLSLTDVEPHAQLLLGSQGKLALGVESTAYLLQVDSDGRKRFLNRVLSTEQSVLRHHTPAAKAAALSVIPTETLRTRAREALPGGSAAELADETLRQLLLWFKRDFFTWVNAAPCDFCGHKKTKLLGGSPPSAEEARYLAGRVEVYSCPLCGRNSRFPRYNDAVKLLESRRGRCGEWANAFTLCAIAMGFQARQVSDWTDHVWTEVWSHAKQRWLHADSCEAALDTPLLYEAGWGKKLTYIIAAGRTGIHDVTKRYTTRWQQLLKRRTAVDERWLATTIATLCARRRAMLSPVEAVQWQQRDELDVVDMGGVRGVKSAERTGRISGSLAWRASRGELGDGSSGGGGSGGSGGGSGDGTAADAAVAGGGWALVGKHRTPALTTIGRIQLWVPYKGAQLRGRLGHSGEHFSHTVEGGWEGRKQCDLTAHRPSRTLFSLANDGDLWSLQLLRSEDASGKDWAWKAVCIGAAPPGACAVAAAAADLLLVADGERLWMGWPSKWVILADAPDVRRIALPDNGSRLLFAVARGACHVLPLGDAVPAAAPALPLAAAADSIIALPAEQVQIGRPFSVTVALTAALRGKSELCASLQRYGSHACQAMVRVQAGEGQTVTLTATEPGVHRISLFDSSSSSSGSVAGRPLASSAAFSVVCTGLAELRVHSGGDATSAPVAPFFAACQLSHGVVLYARACEEGEAPLTDIAVLCDGDEGDGREDDGHVVMLRIAALSVTLACSYGGRLQQRIMSLRAVQLSPGEVADDCQRLLPALAPGLWLGVLRAVGDWAALAPAQNVRAIEASGDQLLATTKSKELWALHIPFALASASAVRRGEVAAEADDDDAAAGEGEEEEKKEEEEEEEVPAAVASKAYTADDLKRDVAILFKQLTVGCGDGSCPNSSHCCASGVRAALEPNVAAATAFTLLAKPDSRRGVTLCAARR